MCDRHFPLDRREQRAGNPENDTTLSSSNASSIRSTDVNAATTCIYERRKYIVPVELCGTAAELHFGPLWSSFEKNSTYHQRAANRYWSTVIDRNRHRGCNRIISNLCRRFDHEQLSEVDQQRREVLQLDRVRDQSNRRDFFRLVEAADVSLNRVHNPIVTRSMHCSLCYSSSTRDREREEKTLTHTHTRIESANDQHKDWYIFVKETNEYLFDEDLFRIYWFTLVFPFLLPSVKLDLPRTRKRSAGEWQRWIASIGVILVVSKSRCTEPNMHKSFPSRLISERKRQWERWLPIKRRSLVAFLQSDANKRQRLHIGREKERWYQVRDSKSNRGVF